MVRKPFCFTYVNMVNLYKKCAVIFELKNFLDMIDSGEINEAENILLDSIDYTDRNEVMAAALFYQYLSEKDSEFLKNNNYTKEEVMSGFKQLLMQSGYTDLLCLVKAEE